MFTIFTLIWCESVKMFLYQVRWVKNADDLYTTSCTLPQLFDVYDRLKYSIPKLHPAIAEKHWSDALPADKIPPSIKREVGINCELLRPMFR